MNVAVQNSSSQKPIVGVGVAVFRQGPQGPEVVLVMRGKPPRQGEWSIPGGRQEWGETLQAAARREVMEETGLTIGPLTLVDVVDGLFYEQNGSIGHHLTLVDYRADWISGDLQAADDAPEACWVPVSALASYEIWPETARVIRDGVRGNAS